jgi:hypothetical protein
MADRRLKTGYEGTNIPSDFTFPSVGIEDVDRAVFTLFNSDINFEVKVNEQTQRVPVVFATGERFALTRRDRPIRDKNHTLILPIISIKRGTIGHKTDSDVFGSAISVRPNSDYVIRKRLDSEDRSYQRLVNRLGIKNSDSIATPNHFVDKTTYPGQQSGVGQIASRRQGGALALGPGYTRFPLQGFEDDHIYEYITIPYPRLLGISYNITFWVQYMSQMNKLIEILLMSFKGPGREFLMKTPAGFDFVAFIQSPITSNDNFEEFTSEERLIRYSFDIRVPAYILAPRHSSLPEPTRKFVSSTGIDFGLSETGNIAVQKVPVGAKERVDSFVLTDVENIEPDGTVEISRGDLEYGYVEEISDPFSSTGSKQTVRLISRNPRSGEAISTGRIVKKIGKL